MTETQPPVPVPDETAAADLIKIRNDWTGAVIFEIAAMAELTGAKFGALIGFAARKAIETGADLTRANLRCANLTDADLTGADLTGANLRCADLTRADLTRANLTGADLTGADLTGANLTDADLTDADLTRADLTRADLRCADLTYADLTGADLTGADLTGANLKSRISQKARRMAAGPALRDALDAVVALLPDAGDAAVVAARKLLEQVP